MRNPWLSIPASEYDEHLSHSDVRQREFLDEVFLSVLKQHCPKRIALLGCATGGGLGHIDPQQTSKVTAVDLNAQYIETTRSRYSDHLPQLELVHADLHSCELDANAFDLIHSALVLEYVDPVIVLTKIARWLAAGGVLVIVLQLESAEIEAVTETGCESLKLLEPLMRLHSPDDIRAIATKVNLREAKARRVQLASGKQFYVGQFTHSQTGVPH